MKKEAIPEGREKYIRWFSEIGKDDVDSVGGKTANLGEMYGEGIPVPPGFVVTAEAYNYFLKKTNLEEKIYQILDQIDIENTKELEEASKKIKEMIVNARIPEDLKEEILEAYEILGFDKDKLKRKVNDVAFNILKTTHEPIFVAVRSSATAEDSEETSFAGQQETYLNVKGNRDIIKAIKKCFASLFTARSIFYRVRNKLEHRDVLIAVIVQTMVDSDKSGVIFTRNPMKEDDNIVIESVYGLGEGIVSGRIEPDTHLVSRDLDIVDQRIAKKKVAITRDSSGKTGEVKLTKDRSESQVLNNYEIKRLADYGLKLEEHYGIPQDIEFAIESGEIYIVQTRPITTKAKMRGESEEITGEEILSGKPASPGIGSGKVRVIDDLKDLNKITKGDVLVTEMTNPDMVVTMQKCSAIVTDEGGMTSHAAIVSREMGIPAIVGAKTATENLNDGDLVTVDGYKGKVYRGEMEKLKEKKVEIRPITDTKTKIKVIVDLPGFAERASKTECKEVGLTRIEGIIAESGKHPYGFLKSGELDKYEEIIFSGISKIGQYFEKIWIRTSDIRSDEYNNLEGAPKESEGNPMLGMHGIRAGLKDEGILRAEIRAVGRLVEEGKKAGLLLPQVISTDEVKKVKKIVEDLNLDLDVGVMVETPASVNIIEELCKEGIDFISFGTNDLTQYTLAIDRNNEEVQYLYDETHLAILSQLSKVIEVCSRYNVETSICGQAGSNKEMAEFLVKKGIDSISVNADKAHEISNFVKELEKDLEERKERENHYEEQEESSREDQEENSESEENKQEEPGQKKSEEIPEIEEKQNNEQDEETEEISKQEPEQESEPAEDNREESDLDKKEELMSKKEAEDLVGDEDIEEEQDKEEQEEEEQSEEKDEDNEELEEVEEEEFEEKLEDDEEVAEEKEEEEEVEKDEFGRRLYNVICDKCGKKTKVPFKPEKGRPVYCQDCYRAIKYGDAEEPKKEENNSDDGEKNQNNKENQDKQDSSESRENEEQNNEPDEDEDSYYEDEEEDSEEDMDEEDEEDEDDYDQENREAEFSEEYDRELDEGSEEDDSSEEVLDIF